jgi:hypothetical protein
MIEIILGIGVVSGAVDKCFKKVVGSEQLFFIVARHYYLTGRPNRLFFRFRGEGSGGVPGGPRGPRGGSGGSRGSQKRKKQKFMRTQKGLITRDSDSG